VDLGYIYSDSIRHHRPRPIPVRLAHLGRRLRTLYGKKDCLVSFLDLRVDVRDPVELYVPVPIHYRVFPHAISVLSCF